VRQSDRNIFIIVVYFSTFLHDFRIQLVIGAFLPTLGVQSLENVYDINSFFMYCIALHCFALHVPLWAFLLHGVMMKPVAMTISRHIRWQLWHVWSIVQLRQEIRDTRWICSNTL